MSGIAVSVGAAQVGIEGGKGALTVSVTSAAAERVVLGVFPPAGGSAETAGDPAWANVERPLREFAAGATEQYAVTLAPPATVRAGAYVLKFIAYPADKAPEEYAEFGQTVRVVVPAAPIPIERPKRRRLWLLLVAAGVLVIGAVAFALLRPGTVAVPDVRGLTSAEAQARLAEVELVPRLEEVLGPRPFGLVADQLPLAPTAVDPGATVLIEVTRGVSLSGLQGQTVANALALLGARLGVDVAGLSVSDAAAALSRDVTVAVEYRISPQPAGTVLEVQAPDGTLAQGDTVVLAVATSFQFPGGLIDDLVVRPDPAVIDRLRDLFGS